MTKIGIARSSSGRLGDKQKSLRRRRKRFIPTMVMRFTMTTILLVGTSLICWTAISSISRPYIMGAQQANEIARKSRELAAINADSAKLTQQCQFLSRPDGIENEARMKGYLKPGEQSLIITAPSVGPQ